MRPLLILSFLFIAHTAFARTIGVPGDAPSIQAGINASSVGDTFLVQPGRYLESIDFMGKDIVVGSLFLATQDSSYILNTTIDAEQKNTVVTFQNGETSAAELCGFTITNGLSQGSVISHLNPGGGICCKNASPYLHHLIVDGNESNLDGGGMYFEKSNSIIEYSVIKNNRAKTSGGGLRIQQGNHKISNCIIDNNNALPGGGADCYQSKVLFYKVLMTNNRYDTMTITSSDINIINCTIAKNDPELYINNCEVNIINSIFWNDTPRIVIVRGDSKYPVSHVTIAFSDIKGGENQISAVYDSLYYENNNIDSDPLFYNITKGDYTLNRNSPCIDSGIAYYQIGDSTIVNIMRENYNGKAPDIGAFESDYTSTIVNENNTYNMSLSNFPNPFNSTTTIHYSLSKPSHVCLAIYTITGQKVIDLLEKSLSVGSYQTQWNGKNKSGNTVSSGVYIIQLNTGMHSLSRRVIVMK